MVRTRLANSTERRIIKETSSPVCWMTRPPRCSGRDPRVRSENHEPDASHPTRLLVSRAHRVPILGASRAREWETVSGGAT